MKRSLCVTSAKNKERQDIKELITFIILAENHGYRMKSHGPVPLIKLNEKTILQKQIEIIKSCFVNYEIIICTGFESNKINQYIRDNIRENVRIVENQIHYNTNCCESIRLCMANTQNQRIFIQQCNTVIYPEHYFDIDYNINSIITQNKNRHSSFEVSAVSNNSNLENLSLGLKNNFWVENFYLYGRNNVKKFYDIVSSINYKTKFLFEAINEFSRNNKIKIYENEINEIIKYNNLKTIKGNK